MQGALKFFGHGETIGLMGVDSGFPRLGDRPPWWGKGAMEEGVPPNISKHCLVWQNQPLQIERKECS